MRYFANQVGMAFFLKGSGHGEDRNVLTLFDDEKWQDRIEEEFERDAKKMKINVEEL